MAASSVFDSLFGEPPAEKAGASIFSDDNPFKRKPGGYTQPPPEIAEVKKRKKEKDRSNEEEKEPERVPSDALGRKKKRKRDQVEAEYEARRYGVDEEAVEEVAGVGRKRKQMESLKDVILEAKEEGFDDESKLLRTVFVGNLPLKIKKKVLIKEFSKFGEVESVRIRSIPLNDSKIPRKGAIMKKQINENVDNVHAYVVYKTEESAQASLANNMAVVGGNHVRVDRACPPRKKLKGDDASDASTLYDTKRTLFIGNLPFDVKDEELYTVFSSIKDLESSIEAIRIVRDPGTSLGKGIAYVMFKTRNAANVAMRRRQLKLRDRDLRVSHARADATPSKKRDSLPAEDTPPTKKFGSNSKYNDSQSESKSRGSLSYQGVKASKSGTEKKTYTAPKKSSSGNKAPEPKVRSNKRPAVAARKARALMEAGGGLKRKHDRQTPETAGQKKKARKFA